MEGGVGPVKVLGVGPLGVGPVIMMGVGPLATGVGPLTAGVGPLATGVGPVNMLMLNHSVVGAAGATAVSVQ